MESSKTHNNPTGNGDIRLHKLYRALNSPHTTTSKRYLELVALAPTATIDQLLCKISSQGRKAHHSSQSNSGTQTSTLEDWPLHRLLACFEVILGSMKRRSTQDDLLPLRSFKACVRLVLDKLTNNDNDKVDCMVYGITKTHAAKCWYKLLDHLARLTQQAGNNNNNNNNSATTSTIKVTGLVKAILTDIQSRQVHLHILRWATNVTEKDMCPHLESSAVRRALLKARFYGLRGLLAQATFFGLDLISHDAYRRLLCQNLFLYFGFESSHIKTESGKRRRLDNNNNQIKQITPQFSLCMVSSQLLVALCKTEGDHRDNLDNLEYQWNNIIGSSSSILARTWTGALLDLLQCEDIAVARQNSDMMDKGRPFYCLTTLLMKLPPDSPVYLHLTPSNPLALSGSSTLSCSMALSTLFAQLVYYLQQSYKHDSKDPIAQSASAGIKEIQTNGFKSEYSMDALMKLLTRLCHVSWRCLLPHLNQNHETDKPDKTGVVSLQEFAERMTGCMTNFLLAFSTYPVSVENLAIMASGDGYGDSHNTTLPSLLSTDLCADVVIRGYSGLTSKVIEQCEPLLGPLLETLMQYIQVVPVFWRVEIGPRIAWCIRSQMALLYADNKLDGSPLLQKFQKLVVYLLHDTGAIKQLAQDSTGLGKYIWEPSILQVLDGLAVAGTLTSTLTTPVNSKHIDILTKAKRALVALEKVSHLPRACERLAETTILDLIDPSFIPGFSSTRNNGITSNQGQSINKFLRQVPTQVWSVYGLLIRLFASLAERTSLLRSKLLHERQFIEVIMELLWRALQCGSVLYTQTQHKDDGIKKRLEACQNVVTCSLQVVQTYRFDNAAIFEWLNWKGIDDNGTTLTLVSALVFALGPWVDDNDDSPTRASRWFFTYYHQVTHALNLLDHLSLFENCGKQMIQDNNANLHRLSQLLIILHTATSIVSNHHIDRSDPLEDSDGCISDGTRLDIDNLRHGSALLRGNPDYKLHRNSERQGGNNDDHSTLVLYTVKYSYSEAIIRILTKVIANDANLKLMILTDSFTRLFAPLVVIDESVPRKFEPGIFTELACMDLDDVAKQLGIALWKRLEELKRLFQFFGQNEQDVNHRHELTAVALVYASFWEIRRWHYTLHMFDFDTTKESIVYSTTPFGLLCHMLMFDEDTDNDTMDNTSNSERNQTRRQTAAQALTVLTLSFRSTWQNELDQGLEDNDRRLQQALTHQFNDDSALDGIRKDIFIGTSDTTQTILVNTRDLTCVSPVFRAMLSDHYSDTSTDTIYLYDITMADLQHFIHISQLLQDNCRHDTTGYDDLLNGIQGDWDQVAALIQMADRYSCVMIQLVGERWIMQNIKTQQLGYSSGCLQIYRKLRDKYQVKDGGGLTSVSWPFCPILNHCVKAILLDLVHLVEATCFVDWIKIDKDTTHLDEIESLCNAALVLLQQR
ncbi:hypothetical protein BC941DRAFT_507819 [Chlamydoabsidia padenii]|nr:hypothetical protein BC941DRAFT_507819 [Chlamydoabsidia padenii]